MRRNAEVWRMVAMILVVGVLFGVALYQTSREAIPTGWQTYVVQSGDTVDGLALRYAGTETRGDTTVEGWRIMVREANMLTDYRKLREGQTIWLPRFERGE